MNKKQKPYGLMAIIAIITLALFACDDGNGTPTHTHTYGAAWQSNATQHWKECTANDGAKTDVAAHEWEWVETTPATPTADGLETETCKTCGAESGNTRIIAKLELETKTYDISLVTLEKGPVKFTVEYKALPTDAEPAYLTYLQTRLDAMVKSENRTSAVNNLITMGGSNHTIVVEYASDKVVYPGLIWDSATRKFKIHNDWISTASGTSGDNALTLGMLDDAFWAVTTPYTPLYTNPATITLSFVSFSGIPASEAGSHAGNMAVTIKSEDSFTPAEWDALVNDVKTVLETAYAREDFGAGNRADFRMAFLVENDATIILQNNLATNWEVKAGVTRGVLFVKTSAISTITSTITDYGMTFASYMNANIDATSQD